MNPDLNTVLDAARKLPISEQRELIAKLEQKDIGMPKVAGNVRKFFGTFDSGDSNSADNDKIDADLAKAYSDNHEHEN